LNNFKLHTILNEDKNILFLITNVIITLNFQHMLVNHYGGN
jgi:hypothetical protein